MSTQFSKDGRYFGQITSDGKLKIWETSTNVFKQEFTPNLHLTSPCTCLHWVQAKSQTPWKKRKNRTSDTSSEELLALGTSSGSLFLYSLATARVETTVECPETPGISCLTWEHNHNIYAGANQYVIEFNLRDKNVKRKWKSGNENIHSILIVPNKQILLTASRSIKLWNLTNKEVIKSFTGHSSDVSLLQFIPSNSDSYFISSSKGDRILNCWNINNNDKDKNCVASLLMEDVAVSLSVIDGPDNTTSIAAVTRSGVAHVYQHTLNGKCGKPIKPKVTVQVASDTGQSKNLVSPIPIIAALLHEDTSLLIAHGNEVALTFESVIPSPYEKIQCLIRKEPKKHLALTESEISKIKRPTVDEKVQYLTPLTNTAKTTFKRKANNVAAEVPMEKRLENLTLNKIHGGVPKADNVAQLLIQGLHSKDKTILQNVLCKRDENVIKNTVRRLPMQAVVPLLTELTALIQGKTLASQTGALWLRCLVQFHAGQLVSNPELIDLLGPILGSIENRLSLLVPLTRLRGRLDLVLNQISDSVNRDLTETDDAVLVYKDPDSSDSESDDNIELNVHSESDQEWAEEEDTENEENVSDVEIQENNISDSEMSV